MVSFGGQKRLGHAQIGHLLVRVFFKISDDEHLSSRFMW